MSSLPIGDPFDSQTLIGPLASQRQRTRVENYIQAAGQDGARLVTGGGRPATMDNGYYVEPTVFADVDPDSQLAQEEVFGPVIAVIPYTDEQQAIAIANNSEFGLGGIVCGADEKRALSVARRVETGTIGVNRYNVVVNAPFGGVKASGLGRECGPEGLAPYLQTKSVFA
jgi:aldehyde dehydrogenase (NAD+)